MATLDAIHIDTTTTSIVVNATFTFVRTNGIDEDGRDAGTTHQVEVRWTTNENGLRRLGQMIGGAPGVLAPVIRVTGSLSSQGSKILLDAVRARPVIGWTARRPSLIGLQMEFIGESPSDENLLDGYSSLGLSLDTTAWSALNAAVERARGEVHHGTE